MKKLIFYLGILCVLVFSHQYAYAADALYLRGDAEIKRGDASASWDNPTDTWKFTESGGVYTLTGVDIPANTGFKITKASDWDGSWGDKKLSPNTLTKDVNGNNPTGNFTLSIEVKNATITLDTNNKTIIVNATFPWVLRLATGGDAVDYEFESIDGTNYVIRNFDKLKNLDSNTDKGKYYFNVVYGSDIYGNSSEWYNPDKGFTSHKLSLNGGGTYYYFKETNGSKNNYDVHWNSNTHVLRFAETVTIPSTFYYRYANKDEAWKFDNIMTKSGDTFKGSFVVTKSIGYINFNSAPNTGWTDNDPTLFGNGTDKDMSVESGKTYPLVAKNKTSWTLTTGTWDFVIDWTTGSPRVTFTKKPNSDIVRTSDTWTVNATAENPEFYVVGNYLNDYKPNPGYLMTSTDGINYKLERFVIQKNSEFAVREYTGKTNHILHGPSGNNNVAVTGKDGEGNSTEIDLQADGNTKVYWWNNGVAMISLNYNKDTKKLTVTPHPEVPNQANFNDGIHGVPYVAFVGNTLAQQPGATTVSGKSTADGWQDGWQAYSANGKPIVMEETIADVGDANRAVYNTCWPPRNRINFNNESNAWTTDGISFKVDPNVQNKRLTKAQALEELKQQGVTMNKNDEKNIPDNAVWTRYNTRNTLIKGRYKLWSGWAGSYVDNNINKGANWNNHNNWGRGTFNASESEQVAPNFVYYAKDALTNPNDQDGNFNFDSEKYFREFSFYSARKDDGTYAYFFVARLSAEDPVVTIHRVSGDRTALEARFRIQKQLTTSKKLTGYELYISNPDGKTYPTTAEKIETFATPMTVGDFNDLPQTQRSYRKTGLEPGDYRYKIVALYEDDVNKYSGESPVMSIFNIEAPAISAKQIINKDSEKNDIYTFDILVTGHAPETYTDEQKALISGYKLTMKGNGNTCGHTKFKVNGSEVTADTDSKGNMTCTLTPDAAGNMPDVTVVNALALEEYNFVLEMIFSDSSIDMPQAGTRAFVYAPRAQLAVKTIEFANDKGITEGNFLSTDIADIRAARNHVKVTADIVAPSLDTSVSDHYDVSYIVRYTTADGRQFDAPISGTTTEVTIDNLPYLAGADGKPLEVANYRFPIATVYSFKDHSKEQVTPYVQTPLTNIFAEEFPEPRAKTESTDQQEYTEHIEIYEGYAERFYGLHSYWQDALLSLNLSSLPVAGNLVGSMAETVASDGTIGVALVEAGGMYSPANVIIVDSDFDSDKYQWNRPMPADHYGDEHYYVENDNNNNHTVTSFYAGDGLNQFFCTTDHTNDDASHGFGSMMAKEATEFFPGTYAADAAATATNPTDKVANTEADWYKAGKVYRKVHHINHEARYFNSPSAYEPHSRWAFPQKEYEPLTIRILYGYNMLTSPAYVTVNGISATETTEAPAAIIAKAAPTESDYATVTTGATESVGFDGLNVNKHDAGTTGIGSIADDDDNAPVEYYNLQGVKVDNPVPGNVYIFRQGSRSGKVLIK